MRVRVKAPLRLLLLLAAAAVVAVVAFTGSRSRAPLAGLAEPVPRAPSASVPSHVASDPPKVDLDRLAQRSAKAPARDLFNARDWRPPAPKALPRPVEPQEEPLPPVPYTYLGRWSEPKGVVVVLAREGRSYLARVSDVLDDAYRIDGIEPTRIVLTYLPRNAMQTIAIAQRAGGGVTTMTVQGNGDAADVDALLHVAMPDTAAVGEEITVLVSLEPRKAAMIERGSVELRYDPAVLDVRRVTGGTNAPDQGRVALELGGGFIGHGGPASTVRLRVVATGATASTQIRLGNLAATDGESRSLAVSVEGPNPRTLAIVRSRQ